MSGYVVSLKDGSKVTIANATKSVTDGSGTYLYDENDVQVASFADGQVSMSYPADSVVEQPPELPAGEES